MQFAIGQQVFIFSKFLNPDGKWIQAKISGIEPCAGLWIENESLAKNFLK